MLDRDLANLYEVSIKFLIKLSNVILNVSLMILCFDLPDEKPRIGGHNL